MLVNFVCFFKKEKVLKIKDVKKENKKEVKKIKNAMKEIKKQMNEFKVKKLKEIEEKKKEEIKKMNEEIEQKEEEIEEFKEMRIEELDDYILNKIKRLEDNKRKVQEVKKIIKEDKREDKKNNREDNREIKEKKKEEKRDIEEDKREEQRKIEIKKKEIKEKEKENKKKEEIEQKKKEEKKKLNEEKKKEKENKNIEVRKLKDDKKDKRKKEEEEEKKVKGLKKEEKNIEKKKLKDDKKALVDAKKKVKEEKSANKRDYKRSKQFSKQEKLQDKKDKKDKKALLKQHQEEVAKSNQSEDFSDNCWVGPSQSNTKSTLERFNDRFLWIVGKLESKDPDKLRPIKKDKPKIKLCTKERINNFFISRPKVEPKGFKQFSEELLMNTERWNGGPDIPECKHWVTRMRKGEIPFHYPKETEWVLEVIMDMADKGEKVYIKQSYKSYLDKVRNTNIQNVSGWRNIMARYKNWSNKKLRRYGLIKPQPKIVRSPLSAEIAELELSTYDAINLQVYQNEVPILIKVYNEDYDRYRANLYIGVIKEQLLMKILSFAELLHDGSCVVDFFRMRRNRQQTHSFQQLVSDYKRGNFLNYW